MTAPSSSKWIQFLVLPVLFYVGVKLSLAFAVMPEVLVMLWIPNALLLAALLHYGFRRYVYFAVLIIAAEIAADYPTFSLVEAVAFGLINLIEVTLAYWLLCRWRFDARFATPGDIGKFVMAGPVIGAFVAACGGAAIYSYFRGGHTSYLDFQQVWWFSDALGLLILTPLALCLWPPLPLKPGHSAAWRWYDGVALAGAVIVLAAFLAADRGMLDGISLRPVLLLPLAVYVAARFGLRATTLALVLLAAVVLYVTKNGQQPFGELPVRETVVLVQEFAIIMSVMALGLAVLLAQARATTRELEARVRDRTAALSEANTQLEKLAVTDSLTNVLNRRALFALLQREIERAQRHQRGLAVIMLDVDHFKAINDRHGHGVGDVVLRHVVAKTTQVIRGTDTMARYGGEEFVLVAPETDRADAVQLAERMRDVLRSSEVAVNHDALHVTASFGVAVLYADDDQPEQILRRADEALYAAKTAGRDRVVAEASSQARDDLTLRD
jgi:diguanylate cyclase (GGDEF)-like protein